MRVSSAIKSIILVFCLFGCSNSGQANPSSSVNSSATIVGNWQLVSVTEGGKTEIADPSKKTENIQMVFTDKKLSMLGAHFIPADFPQDVNYYRADTKILITGKDGIEPMFEIVSLSVQNLGLKLADFTMNFRRITDDEVVFETSLIKRLPKPPPPLDSGDLLKDSNGRLITYSTQEGANRACSAVGKHLMTAREFALNTKDIVIFEKSDMDFGNFDKIPDGYSTQDFRLIEVTNPDNKPDTFYFSNKRYYPPYESELGKRWFRTSSLDKNGQQAVVFEGSTGSFSKAPIDSSDGNDGVRCK